jgi:hypothetical protein
MVDVDFVGGIDDPLGNLLDEDAHVPGGFGHTDLAMVI